MTKRAILRASVNDQELRRAMLRAWRGEWGQRRRWQRELRALNLRRLKEAIK